MLCKKPLESLKHCIRNIKQAKLVSNKIKKIKGHSYKTSQKEEVYCRQNPKKECFFSYK